MKAKLTVCRVNPDCAAVPRFDTFEIDVTRSTTVLECLAQVKEEQDASLTFRSACRVGACGECACRVNGRAVMICKERALPEIEATGGLRVEPLPGFPVMRDLVVDLDPFWGVVRHARPWLEPGGSEGPLSGELLARLQKASFCNLCGICHSECPVVRVDPTFAGPAALTKVYRFAADGRDGRAGERAAEAAREDGGPYGCARCYLCQEACPKGADPADSIAALKRIALRSGTVEGAGARHAQALAGDVRSIGRPRDVTLAARTWGWNPLRLIKSSPLAIRLWRLGKLGWRAKRASELDEIHAIVDAVGKKRIG